MEQFCQERNVLDIRHKLRFGKAGFKKVRGSLDNFIARDSKVERHKI